MPYLMNSERSCASERSAAGPPAPHVLIVEDDEDIADSLATLLDAEGYAVATASDGPRGVDQAVALHPDVILLDLMLPRLDGVGVAAELKRRGGGLERIPLILLSAGRQVEEAAVEVGTPYFLPKPFDLDAILALLERALRERHNDDGRVS